MIDRDVALQGEGENARRAGLDPEPPTVRLCPARPLVKADHRNVAYPCVLPEGHAGPHRVRI